MKRVNVYINDGHACNPQHGQMLYLALASILPVIHALSPHGFRLLGPQAVKLWKLEQR